MKRTMADKLRLGGVGSYQPLDMDDKSSLDREVSSFCRNLEAIKGKMIDEWALSQQEANIDSMKESKETFFFGIDEIIKAKKNIADQNVRAVEMKELVEKVNTLDGDKAAMESEVAEKQIKIQEENSKLEADYKDLEALEKVTVAKKEKVDKALSFFKERLGLRFDVVKSEEQVKVIFDRIDVNNLEREFSFDTKIVNSKYIISNCEPPINQLDVYVEMLNKSNDFGRFVLTMRKAFKRALIAESGQNVAPNMLATVTT